MKRKSRFYGLKKLAATVGWGVEQNDAGIKHDNPGVGLFEQLNQIDPSQQMPSGEELSRSSTTANTSGQLVRPKMDYSKAWFNPNTGEYVMPSDKSFWDSAWDSDYADAAFKELGFDIMRQPYRWGFLDDSDYDSMLSSVLAAKQKAGLDIDSDYYYNQMYGHPDNIWDRGDVYEHWASTPARRYDDGNIYGGFGLLPSSWLGRAMGMRQPALHSASGGVAPPVYPIQTSAGTVHRLENNKAWSDFQRTFHIPGESLAELATYMSPITGPYRIGAAALDDVGHKRYLSGGLKGGLLLMPYASEALRGVGRGALAPAVARVASAFPKTTSMLSRAVQTPAGHYVTALAEPFARYGGLVAADSLASNLDSRLFSRDTDATENEEGFSEEPGNLLKYDNEYYSTPWYARNDYNGLPSWFRTWAKDTYDFTPAFDALKAQGPNSPINLKLREELGKIPREHRNEVLRDSLIDYMFSQPPEE